MAVLVIPLDQKQPKWTEISFGKIPSNSVLYSETALKVHVKSSASPLVYKLDPPARIQSFEVSLKFSGDLNAAPQEKQIEEDSLFRLGLVAEGSQTLTGVKKLFAPDWVKRLFALAPSGAGLDKIYFFNVGRTLSQNGLSRIHPKSELMKEEIVGVRKAGENTLKINKQLESPLKVAAIWISIDGDDTQSEFDTTIENITLHTQD